MKRYVLALAMALLVVTAGCSTGVLQDEGTPAPDDATTPDEDGATATPTTTSAASSSGFPPGVSESGLENETALFAANERALDGSAHLVTARTDLRARGDTRVNVTSRSTLRATGDGAVYRRHAVNNSLQGDTLTEVWTGGDETLTRTWENTSFRPEPKVTFGTAASPDDTGVSLPGTGGTLLLVSLLRYEVRETSDGRVTLTATAVNRTALAETYGGDATVAGFEGELVVDASGRIRSFEGRLDVEPGEGTAGAYDYVEGSYELAATEDVDVERPDWVSAARDAVPIVDVSVEVVDGAYVEVTNEGPDAIPAGVRVGLFEGSAGGTVATLEASVAPGESIYLYERPDGSVPGVARERPDEEARELSGSYTVHVTGTDGDVLVEETVTVEG